MTFCRKEKEKKKTLSQNFWPLNLFHEVGFKNRKKKKIKWNISFQPDPESIALKPNLSIKAPRGGGGGFPHQCHKWKNGKQSHVYKHKLSHH